MADYVVVPKSSMDATADAIREKTGSQADIEWTQDGFADAIEEISSGGYSANDINNATRGAVLVERPGINGVINLSGTSLFPFAFCGTKITEVHGSNITSTINVFLGGGNQSVGHFANCSELTVVDLPLLTSIGQSMFDRCEKMQNFYFPSATSIGYAALSNCALLETVVLPVISGNLDRFATACPKLESIDLGLPTSIKGNTFANNSVFNILIIRKDSAVCTLADINAFNNTPFASGGSGGTLYVPNDLISSYQSATNWSTILGYTNNQIKSIESTHTDPNADIDLTLYYADGTAIGGGS